MPVLFSLSGPGQMYNSNARHAFYGLTALQRWRNPEPSLNPLSRIFSHFVICEPKTTHFQIQYSTGSIFLISVKIDSIGRF
jgi:hypothetical protein